MGTFDDLAVGDRFVSPPRRLDGTSVQAFVDIGGYTHPLFTDPEYAAASAFGRRPVPGPALLTVMGGSVEQTGRFDRTVIGLVGFGEVRFAAPAFEGDEVRTEVEVLAKDERSGGRGLMTMAWRCSNERGELLVESVARMLFRREEG